MSKKKKPAPLPESLGLEPFGVDTHAHLDMPGAFEEGPAEVIARAGRAGVADIGNVFLGPDAYDLSRQALEPYPELFFLLGVHPHDASGLNDEGLSRMRQAFLRDERLRAVGEIGLDYHYDRSPREVQREAFVRQLAMARELGKPVAVHCREAEDDMLAILREQGFEGWPVMWHCFGGGPELAGKIIDAGWTISIPGPVTYKKNEDLRRAVEIIPLERLVVETDAPYLAPEPHRGSRNEPAMCAFAAACVAEVKGLDVQVAWKVMGDNARRFFGIAGR